MHSWMDHLTFICILTSLYTGIAAGLTGLSVVLVSVGMLLGSFMLMHAGQLVGTTFGVFE